jgi:hypothetical protein
MSRSIVVRMRRRAPNEVVEPFRRRVHESEGHALRDALARWTTTSIPTDAWPEMPPGIEDRNADIWEALFIVADAAGGSWPERARRAAVTLVTDVTLAPPSLGVRLLEDIRTVFGSYEEKDHLTTESLLFALVEMEEAPWGDLRGKPLDARGLARRLSRYEVKPKTIRDGNVTAKGYDRADFFDAWSRYVTCDGPANTKFKEIKEQVNGGAPLAPDFAVTTVTPSQVPTMTGTCPVCQAPPPRRGSVGGVIACDHQIAAGLTA